MPIINWNTAHRAGVGPVAGFVGWLRKDRWFADEYQATQSRHQYSLLESRPPPDRYGTSILGVINGYLPSIGIVLVCHFVPESGMPAPPYLSVRRRWW